MKIIGSYSSLKLLCVSLLLTFLTGCGGGGDASTTGGGGDNSNVSAVHCISVSTSSEPRIRYVLTNNCSSTIIVLTTLSDRFVISGGGHQATTSNASYFAACFSPQEPSLFLEGLRFFCDQTATELPPLTER
ncbi:MAG: hypothetical protein GKR96_01880 [Gammaproteobacteria bacterium]|nr:hypothetical protein [Gammaproteobacteria bacterium]